MQDMKLLERFKKGKLSEDEIRDIVWNNHGDFEIESGTGRWNTCVTTVYKFGNGEVWAIDWYSGLTEYQKDEFPEPPYPCKIVEKQVIEYSIIPIEE